MIGEFPEHEIDAVLETVDELNSRTSALKACLPMAEVVVGVALPVANFYYHYGRPLASIALGVILTRDGINRWLKDDAIFREVDNLADQLPTPASQVEPTLD